MTNTPLEKKWEQEFDEMIERVAGVDGVHSEDFATFDPSHDNAITFIKTFIQQIAKEERRKGRAEAISSIRKNIVLVDTEPIESGSTRFIIEDLDNLLEAALETPNEESDA